MVITDADVNDITCCRIRRSYYWQRGLVRRRNEVKHHYKYRSQRQVTMEVMMIMM